MFHQALRLASSDCACLPVTCMMVGNTHTSGDMPKGMLPTLLPMGMLPTGMLPIGKLDSWVNPAVGMRIA